MFLCLLYFVFPSAWCVPDYSDLGGGVLIGETKHMHEELLQHFYRNQESEQGDSTERPGDGNIEAPAYSIDSTISPWAEDSNPEQPQNIDKKENGLFFHIDNSPGVKKLLKNYKKTEDYVENPLRDSLLMNMIHLAAGTEAEEGAEVTENDGVNYGENADDNLDQFAENNDERTGRIMNKGGNRRRVNGGGPIRISSGSRPRQPSPPVHLHPPSNLHQGQPNLHSQPQLGQSGLHAHPQQNVVYFNNRDETDCEKDSSCDQTEPKIEINVNVHEAKQTKSKPAEPEQEDSSIIGMISDFFGK